MKITLIKIILLLILLPVLAFGGLVLYLTVTDYQPPASESLEVSGPGTAPVELPDTLDMIVWNIGYAGLGKDMDFFYDGGEQVRPEKAEFDGYLSGITGFTKEIDSVDFLLYQEVDKESKRSHFTNEVDLLAEQLPGFNHAFALNYNVKFIPAPFTDPLGKTYGGLTTFSQYMPMKVMRHSFPGNFDWPKRAYMLDRCFMVHRYNVFGGKELILINTHNSAYDDGGLKKMQMDFLKSFVEAEYNKGNYIIVGGDWNQNPPNFRQIGPAGGEGYEQLAIPMDYLPASWQWAYDPTVSTNRKLAAPYDPHSTITTVIDFYLVSPNVRVLKVQGVDLKFQWSDHQPVYLKVALQTGRPVPADTIETE